MSVFIAIIAFTFILYIVIAVFGVLVGTLIFKLMDYFSRG